MRKRKVWVEPLFAEAKEWHGLRRYRLRGLARVNGEALLIAAGQNLKRLLSRRGWGRRPWPNGAAGLALPRPEPAPTRLAIPAATAFFNRLGSFCETSHTATPRPGWRGTPTRHKCRLGIGVAEPGAGREFRNGPPPRFGQRLWFRQRRRLRLAGASVVPQNGQPLARRCPYPRRVLLFSSSPRQPDLDRQGPTVLEGGGRPGVPGRDGDPDRSRPALRPRPVRAPRARLVAGRPDPARGRRNSRFWSEDE